MKNIMVVGGCGYIGSHTVVELLEKGKNVVVVDSLITSNEDTINNIKKIVGEPKCNNLKFYKADIKDKEAMRAVFKENAIDAVVHFAAFSLVGESVKEPLKYYDNNVAGTKCLLEVMKEFNVNKIVFSSTAAVYGEPERVPIKEVDRKEPINTYGETKLAIEKMFSWCDKAYGLKYVALRYFNACGANETGLIGERHNPETHLIPLILQVPNGKREFITVFGDDYKTEDGTCIRDYIHVVDLADAHIRALDYLDKGGNSDCFNLGGMRGYSVKEVISMCEKVVGKPINKKMGERREGDPSILTADSSKAFDVLGFKAKHSLEDIVRTAWNFHSKNN